MAQSDFRPGYVVGLAKDTTFGYIDYKGDRANSEYCLFRKDPGAVETRYTPDRITAYRFADSKYYVSRSVKKGEKSEPRFLEYLINGVVDFYYYRDNEGDHYLLDTGDGCLAELKDQEKNLTADNRVYARTAKEYVGVLKYAFRQSPGISKEVEDISLDRKSLIKVAHKYHNEVCKDNVCIIYEKKLLAFHIIIGPVVTVNVKYAWVNQYYDQEYYYLQKSNFNTPVFPAISLFALVNLPYVNERLFLRYEATVCKYRLETTGNEYYDPYMKTNIYNDIQMKRYALNNAVNLRYEFSGKKFRPYLQAGFFLNYNFKTEYYRTLLFTYQGFTYGQNFTENPFVKLDHGLSIGLGLTYIAGDRPVYFGFVYQHGKESVLKASTFALNLGIQLGK